jgi:hypothetical protein
MARASCSRAKQDNDELVDFAEVGEFEVEHWLEFCQNAVYCRKILKVIKQRSRSAKLHRIRKNYAKIQMIKYFSTGSKAVPDPIILFDADPDTATLSINQRPKSRPY